MYWGSHFHESSLHQDLDNEYRYWRNQYTCFPAVRLLSIISVFSPYFVHHDVQFHLLQFWDGLIFSWRQVQCKKDHQLFFQNLRYPSCLCHNWLQRIPAIVVEECFPPPIIHFKPCRHQLLKLLYFHQRTYARCWGYLRKPAIMESPSKTADTILDDLMSTAWSLWFMTQFSL